MFPLHLLPTSTPAGHLAADLLVVGMPIAAAVEACEPVRLAGVAGFAKRWQRNARQQGCSMKPVVNGERGMKRAARRSELSGTEQRDGLTLDTTGASDITGFVGSVAARGCSVIAIDPSTTNIVCASVSIRVSSRPFNGPQGGEPPPRAGS